MVAAGPAENHCFPQRLSPQVDPAKSDEWAMWVYNMWAFLHQNLISFLAAVYMICLIIIIIIINSSLFISLVELLYVNGTFEENNVFGMLSWEEIIFFNSCSSRWCMGIYHPMIPTATATNFVRTRGSQFLWISVFRWENLRLSSDVLENHVPPIPSNYCFILLINMQFPWKIVESKIMVLRWSL